MELDEFDISNAVSIAGRVLLGRNNWINPMNLDELYGFGWIRLDFDGYGLIWTDLDGFGWIWMEWMDLDGFE